MANRAAKLQYTPLGVLAWTWTLYLTAYFLLAPFEYERSLGGEAIGLLVLSLTAFATGCWQSGFHRLGSAASQQAGSPHAGLQQASSGQAASRQAVRTHALNARQARRFDRAVQGSALLGLLGTGLITFEKFATGQFSFSKSIGEVRLEQLMGGSGNQGSLLMILGMATYSFCNVAVILHMLRGEVCTRTTGRWVCACWFAPALIVMLYGGRSSAVLMLVQVAAAGWVRRAQGRSFLPRAHYVRQLLAVYGALVVVGFLYVFASRATAFGDRTSSDLVYGYSDKADAEISPEVQNYLDRAGWLGEVASTLMMTLAYATQSLPELDYLITENSDAGPYWGGLQLEFLYRAIEMVTGLDLGVSEIADEVHHGGWFFTAWGGMYLDFGFWGAVGAMFLLGMLARIWYTQAIGKQSVGASLLLVQLYVFLVGSPVHSSLCTGNSLQLLFCSGAAIWYMRKGKVAWWEARGEWLRAG